MISGDYLAERVKLCILDVSVNMVKTALDISKKQQQKSVSSRSIYFYDYSYGIFYIFIRFKCHFVKKEIVEWLNLSYFKLG